MSIRISIVMFSVSILVLLVPVGSASASCWDRAETQYELNNCAGKELQSADHELNAVYREVLKKKADDPQFIAKFRPAQRAWLKWRDAELNALYPDYEAGSVIPMCWGLAKAELTKERTRQLRQWLDGTEEGDVCAGSIPQVEKREARH